MNDLFLGIDLGTSSSKALLSTAAGTVVTTASRPHAMSLPRPGWAEVDAEAVWWGDVAALSRELAGRVGGDRVAGVCVSGVGPCLLPCDADARPLRPAILYGIDSRAAAEIDELTTRFGADEIFAHGGKQLSSQAIGPKLRWLRRHEPQVWARTAGWYSSSSFAVARLTGQYVLDHHTASQCDPLYDIHRGDWSPDWAAQVAPGVPLPRLAWPGEIVGTVTADAARQTGLPAGTPVAAGTVDAWAEAFSVGVRRPGDLMLMYGSTMFFVQALESFRAHPMLWTTAGAEPGMYTLAAGMATSGSLTGWLQELTGGASFADLVTEAAATPPGADGLIVLPYFAGERTPHFDPRARGVVAGLTLRHRRGHLFRAAYEGIAYGIRQIMELIDDAGGGPAARIVAVGGGTQGGLWTRIVTDVTGREQLLPEQTVGASYGGALLAAIGTGAVPPDTDWTRIAGVLTPDPGTARRYDELYRTFTELYPATRSLVHRLAEVQEASARADGPVGAADRAGVGATGASRTRSGR
jgi:xylulokinase